MAPYIKFICSSYWEVYFSGLDSDWYRAIKLRLASQSWLKLVIVSLLTEKRYKGKNQSIKLIPEGESK